MGDKPFDNINMIPFIDVMLVLLTIVLTTSTFIASGKIPINLPQAEIEAKEDKKTLVITIDKAGTIYYEDGSIGLDELGGRLSAFAKDTPILLRADKTIALQIFIDAADMLNRLEFSKVAVMTESK
ncbi:MAG: biopolymer transporter ExbD [Helicobacteraceae bacterium]|jgi:biopolymer transport protein ExbD|nr:biopolymer transporter ExbD [Helicobacteraceae bacterium]